MVSWKLKVEGKLAHSGFPNHGCNAIELAHDCLDKIQKSFYASFPKHEKESLYNFGSSSSMKPTRMSSSQGTLNQIPAHCQIEGDIRLSPFYSMKDVQKVISDTVDSFDLSTLADPVFRGPDSKYGMGKVSFEWLSTPIEGLACDLESKGHLALCQATKEVFGHVKPIADLGTLPLVADLKNNGFDVQTVGYGIEELYHNDNEACRLSDFSKGFRVLTRILDLLNQQ